MSTSKHHRELQTSKYFKFFEDMFNGTLGTWNTTMLDSELKDNKKPVCLRPYPIARVDKAI